MEPDPFLDHLRQVYGVRIDLEWDELHQNVKRVKCSGHWLQIQQLQIFLHPPSPSASSQPSTQPTSAKVTSPAQSSAPALVPAPASAPMQVHPQHPASVVKGREQPIDVEVGATGLTGRPVPATRGATEDLSSLNSSSVKPSSAEGRRVPIVRAETSQKVLKVHSSSRKPALATAFFTSPPPQSSSSSSSEASFPLSVTHSSSSQETQKPLSSTGPCPK